MSRTVARRVRSALAQSTQVTSLAPDSSARARELQHGYVSYHTTATVAVVTSSMRNSAFFGLLHPPSCSLLPRSRSGETRHLDLPLPPRSVTSAKPTDVFPFNLCTRLFPNPHTQSTSRPPDQPSPPHGAPTAASDLDPGDGPDKPALGTSSNAGRKADRRMGKSSLRPAKPVPGSCTTRRGLLLLPASSAGAYFGLG